MKNKNESTSHDIDVLLDMLTDLNSKVQRETKLTCLSKDEYDQLHGQFKLLDRHIFDHKDLSIDSNDRLEQLVDIMSSIADLDFSQEAEVREEYNHLDYIAISLNLMRERLEQRVFEMKRMAHVIDSFTDLYLITDLDGLILRSNKVLKTHYQINEDEVVGMHIKSFFESPLLKSNYSLNFDRDRVIHDIQQGFIDTPNTDVVLRISGKVYHAENGEEIGYCYKVEPISKKLYLNTASEKTKSNLISELQQVIDKMSAEISRGEEQRQILKDIQQTYIDKNDLSFMETMILNSINEHLKSC